MASVRVGLPAAKRATKASLSPAPPSPSSAYSRSPSSPSTASFSPSSPRSPAYPTLPLSRNCSSENNNTVRRLQTKHHNRSLSSSLSSSFPSVNEVLGFSPSSSISREALRFYNGTSDDGSAALLPRIGIKASKLAPAPGFLSRLKLPDFLASTQQTSHPHSTLVGSSSRHDASITGSSRGGSPDRMMNRAIPFSDDCFPLENVRCRDTVFDVCFHPTRAGLLAAGLVNGGVEFHQLPTAEEVCAYLETCRQRRQEERAAARRTGRLKRKFHQCTDNPSKTTGQSQLDSITTTITTTVETRWQPRGPVAHTAEKPQDNIQEKEPLVLPSASLRQRGRDSNSPRVKDSFVSTTEDRKKRKERPKTRVRLLKGEGNGNGADEDNNSNNAEGGCLRRPYAEAAEQQQMNTDDENPAQNSTSDDYLSEESTSSEDEICNDLTRKKDIQNFETRVGILRPHKRGCRAVRFSHDGLPINALCVLTNDVVAAGDDGGCITLWDIRQAPTADPVLQFHDHEDFISDLAAATVSAEAEQQQTCTAPSPRDNQLSSGPSLSSSNSDTSHLPSHILATGGDMLGVFDLRRKALLARSDALGEDLHCVQIVKNGSKVVCGCQDGSLSIFSWGDFGDLNDRLTGHKQSIDAMAKLEEDVLLTGSSDGLIRVVQLFPNAILGVLGQHKDGLATVEKLALNPDKSLLASCSYDETISIFQVAAAQRLIDGRAKRGKLAKKINKQHVVDLRKDNDFFDDL